MTYADLVALLDLPPTDDADEQIRLLQERRAEQLEACHNADLNFYTGTGWWRLRRARLAEIRQVTDALLAAGAPLEPEGGDDG